MATWIGSLWTVDVAEVSVIGGGAAGAPALLAIGTSIRRRTGGSAETTRADAGWIGLLTYSMALALLLALGRTTSAVPGGNVALITRYGIVAALCISAVAAVLVVRRPAWPAGYVAVTAVVTSLVTHAIGGGKLAAAERNYAPLEIVTVTLRVNAVEALTSLQIKPSGVPAAQEMKAYPFYRRLHARLRRLRTRNHPIGTPVVTGNNCDTSHHETTTTWPLDV